MRAFVITGPGTAGVEHVDAPEPTTGQVVVDVERVGVCGTDVEFFTGVMDYLRTGEATYPIRIGHEWVGMVAAVGPGVDQAWVGARVTADTMLGCQDCERCADGRQHLCGQRHEIGIRAGWPGALAEQLPVPVTALHRVPDAVDSMAGAMIEPGANAFRTLEAADVGPGDRLLVLGNGTIGTLVAMIARTRGVEVHLMGRDPAALAFSKQLGFGNAWTRAEVPALSWDAVVDASYAAELPGLAAELVEPGRRVVYIGLAGEPSLLDTRALVFKDVTAVGILSGSGGIEGIIELYASGEVDPRPLVAATVELADTQAVLAGRRRPEWGAAPKVHIDPAR